MVHCVLSVVEFANVEHDAVAKWRSDLKVEVDVAQVEVFELFARYMTCSVR